MHPSEGDRILKGSRDMALTDDVFKSLGAPLSCNRQVSHDASHRWREFEGGGRKHHPGANTREKDPDTPVPKRIAQEAYPTGRTQMLIQKTKNPLEDTFESWEIAGTPTHRRSSYRCFLPDLAGFTEHQSWGPAIKAVHQRILSTVSIYCGRLKDFP